MRKLTTVLMAAIMVFTLCACGTTVTETAATETETETEATVSAETAASEETETPAPETEAETSEWDFGDRLELSENGEVLTVRLEANATTGYSWSYKIWDEGSLELLTNEYIEAPHAEGMVGTGGAWIASFRLTSERDGKNYINFYYSRGEMEIPDYVVDLYFDGGRLRIDGEHVNELSLYEFEDGEFETIELDFENMFEESVLSFYATADVISPFVLTEEEFKEVKPGDSFTGNMYGGDDEVTVDVLEETETGSFRINDNEELSYSEHLGGWIIRGLDDDILYNTDKTISIHFTNETHIEDQMEEILKTGNSGTIYDKLHDYQHVKASLKVKDGTAEEITIFYHP